MREPQILLRNTSHLHQMLVENCGTALLLAHPDGSIVYANTAAAALFGYEQGELAGHTLKELFHPSDAFNTTPAEQVFARDLTGIKRSGELFDCRLISTGFTDIEGNARVSIAINDFSDSSNNEKKAGEAFESLELLLSNTEESFILVNKDLRIVMFNLAASERTKKIMGFELYKGMNVLDMTRSDRRDYVAGLYPHVFDGEIKETEVSFSLPDGTSKTFHSTFKPARNSNGEIVAALVNVRDVTEARAAEQRLITSEDLYRKLFYNNPMPMWTYDQESLRFLDVNDAATTHYGYSREEFFGMTILDIRPVEEVDRLNRFLRLNSSTSQLYRGAWRHKKKNGEIIYVEISSHSIHVAGKTAKIVLANDVTERLKAEAELLASNERFKLAGSATFDVIYDWDIIANEVVWSENLKTVFGHDPTETTLEHWAELIHPDDRAGVTETLDTFIHDSNRSNFTFEYRYRTSDGRYTFVVDRGYVMRNETSDALRMIGAMKDISAEMYQRNLLDLELRIYEISSTPGASFREVTRSLLTGVEELHPDMYTSLMLLLPNGTVKTLSSPRLPEEYQKSIDGAAIGPKAGSCGTAMYLKLPVIVEDIDSDPLWDDYRALAQKFGLRACWSIPIIGGDRVLASFAIYYLHPRKPLPQEWNTIKRISNLTRILMDNHESIEQMKTANERFDIVTRATNDLIWDWNLETGNLYRDPGGVKKVYGVSSNESIDDINKWLMHIHPDDVEKVQGVINNILTAGHENTFDVEYRFQREDGGYNYIYDRGIIMRDEDGIPSRMIGGAQNITQRKLLEQELLSQEVNRQKIVSQTIIDTQESERAEIGKELHDNVNQMLTTTKLYLDLAQSNPEMKDELLEKSTVNIKYIINEIRKISRALMLPSLGDLGLVDSINDLAEGINTAKQTKVQVNAEGFDEELLEENQKLVVFRIVQEALNNILNHAAAVFVRIDLQIHDNYIRLTVADNGKGFDPGKTRKGIGLNNIQNRVSLFNGTLSINSSSGRGCELVVQIPLSPQIKTYG